MRRAALSPAKPAPMTTTSRTRERAATAPGAVPASAPAAPVAISSRRRSRGMVAAQLVEPLLARLDRLVAELLAGPCVVDRALLGRDPDREAGEWRRTGPLEEPP